MLAMHRQVLFASALAVGIGMSDARAEPVASAAVRVVAGGSSAQVRRNRLMPWRKLGSSVVPDGSELSCEETCRVKVDADNVLTLTPGAVVSVASFFYVPLLSRDSLVPAHQVELREGKIEALSPSARAMPLVVSALGSSHVALRAGAAQIALKRDHLAVEASDGTVRVGANRKWISLEKGQSSILPAQGGPTPPVPSIQAPEWTADPNCTPGLALERDGAPAVLGSCWKPVGRAASYVVELSRDAGFAKVESVEPTASTSWSKQLPEGRYFLRARAIDEDGLVSAHSATRKLGTIAVKLPPGSAVDGSARTFTVPQGRSLEIPDPSGLETAMDSGGFLPAQQFIVMDGVPNHVVRFRFKDDPGSIGSAVLQRRALSAEVAFSPKLAHWPQDPIDITVTLSDASGVVDPSRVSPKMHVLLGLAEIQVQWSHSGRVWAARLNPRNVAPTVIRVIAEDEFGTTIGRNFVEVDQNRVGQAAPPAGGYVAHN
jgi:hypothetical protein